ncbi:MAG: hypothetical protein ACE5IH_10900 [Thermodesulfobacteriota bacterium]
MEGRDYCIPDDIKRLAPHILSHRVILNPERDTGSVQGREDIIKEILTEVEVPL